MSTISDVAREAGVSVATVSRALRGLDRVSPATRARVEEVATRLQYIASPTATSLASGRTRVVAVVAPFLTRWFFATLVSSIEKTLRTHNHHVMLFDLEEDRYDARLQLSADMLWKRADGVITLNIPLDTDEVELLDRVGLPVVAVGTPVARRPLVAIDDTEAMRLATQHLIDLGHHDVAYIGSVPANVAHVMTPQTRLDSFRATLAGAGLSVRPDWILDADWTAESAAAHTHTMLTSVRRPTALVAASDEMAIGGLQAAAALGLKVPDDLSIVGIDDFSLSNVLGLTTVRQDVAEQGRLAAQLLIDALLEDQPLTEAASIVPVELVVRQTTAAPSR